MVPTWGCSTARTPRLAASSASRSRLVSSTHPAVVVEHRAGVVALGAGGRRQHQDARAGGVIALEQPFDLGHGVVGDDMEQQGGEPADGLQAVVVQDPAHGVGLGGQEPVGPELGGGQADLAHLGQHPVAGQLVAPAGHLAHPPGDGGAGDPGLGGRRFGWWSWAHLFHPYRSVQLQGRGTGFGDPAGLQRVGDRARRGSPPRDDLGEGLELGPVGGQEPVHEELRRAPRTGR